MSQKNKKKNIGSQTAQLSGPQTNYFSILTWISLIWMGFILVKYLQSDPIGPILEHADSWFPPGLPQINVIGRDLFSLFISSGIFLGAWGLGMFLTKKFSFPSSLGRIAISATLGFGVIGDINLIIGALQFLSQPVLISLWCLFVAVGVIAWKIEGRKVLSDSFIEFNRIRKESNFFLSALLILILGVAFLMAFVPECFYDSLVYHLGAPRFYLHEGGIRFYPNLHFNYPLNIQFIYMLGLGLGGEASAKLIHWIMGILLGLGFFAWSYENEKPQIGVWSAIFFLSIPVAQMNLWTTGVDVGLSLYALASAWCWASGLWVLASVFAGLCFSAKLTGGLVIPILLLVNALSMIQKKSPIKDVLKQTFLMGLIATLVALPWMIKAAVFTGNPVFPFLGKFFGGLDVERTSRFFGESQGVTPKSVFGWIFLPWSLTFEGLSGLSYLGPLFLTLLPLSILFLIFGKEIPIKMKWIFLFSVLGMIALAFVNRLTRYWLPFISISFLSMSWVVSEIYKGRPLQRFIAIGFFFIMGFINTVHAFRVAFDNYDPWGVILGKESIIDYQSYTHSGLNPYPPIKMVDWAQKNLPKKSKLLIIGDEKVGNISLSYVASGVYDRPILSTWLKKNPTVEGLRKAFDENRITFVLSNPIEGKRLLGYGTADYSIDELAVICEFWDKYIRTIHQEVIPEKGGRQPPMFLYQVYSDAALPPPPPGWNPVLWLYEESIAPAEDPQNLFKRIALYEDLVAKKPTIVAFQNRLFELKQRVPQKPQN